MSELRKNIYAATKELPVEVQAKGKTLFFITNSIEEKQEQPIISREEEIKLIVRLVLEEFGTSLPENKPREIGTIPVEIPLTYKSPPITGTMSFENTDKTKTIIGTRYEVTATTLPMWCQGHFEQGVTHTCYKISYEDENGVEVLKDKWFCEKCVRGYMNRVGKVYGHLE